MDPKYAIEIISGQYVYAESLETAIVTAGMHGDATIRAIVPNSAILTFIDDHVLMPDGECVPQCYCCVRVIGRFVDTLERREEALKRSKGRDGTPEPKERYEPAKIENTVELESSTAYAQRIMKQRVEAMKVLARLKPRDLK